MRQRITSSVTFIYEALGTFACTQRSQLIEELTEDNLLADCGYEKKEKRDFDFPRVHKLQPHHQVVLLGYMYNIIPSGERLTCNG